MRLHLDTSDPASLETKGAASAVSGAQRPSAPNTAGAAASAGSGPDSRDSVAVSGASSAWAASFSDRAARVGQLAALVQNGTYRVSGTAVSQAIVASATK